MAIFGPSTIGVTSTALGFEINFASTRTVSAAGLSSSLSSSSSLLLPTVKVGGGGGGGGGDGGGGANLLRGDRRGIIINIKKKTYIFIPN
jgi:hypothetical protein